MKLEFDNLNLVEAKMLLDCLTAFRAGLPFSWAPPRLLNLEDKNNERANAAGNKN